MTRVATVLSRQIVSVAIIIYCIGFWRSASQLPDGPAVVYPQLFIVGLLLFVVADVVAMAIHGPRDEPVGSSTPDPSTSPGAAASTDASLGSASSPAASTGVSIEDRSLVQAAGDIWREQHKILVTAIATLVTIRLISVLGFYTAIAIFLGAMYWYLGVRRPLRLLVLWASSLLVAWGLFTGLLGVRLPTGVFI